MVLRGLLNPVLLRFFDSSQYDIRNTLIISGYPRSGTTWLAELVSLLPSSAVLFEPLSPRNVPEAAHAGLNWQNFHLPGEVWPEGEVFLERVLKGQVLNRWTTSHLPFHRTVGVNRWIVKMVRANQMLGWITDRFAVPPPVVMIRHPCAVFASLISRGWRSPDRAPVNLGFFAAYPHYREVLTCCRTTEEFFAVLWCIDQYCHLALPGPRPYRLVSYEWILSKGVEAVKEVFDHWRIDMPASLERKLHTPSGRASDDFSRDPVRMLCRWQKKLTRRQVERVLTITREFGLDFYDDGPEPDYERLFGTSPIVQNR